MNKEVNVESNDQRTQYILDENGELTEILKVNARPVEYPIKYKLKNAFEVFVRVNHTENYWISNYGRCVNNLSHKDKNTFYEHKQGQCHYTVFEIEKELVSCPIIKSKRKPNRPNKQKEKLEKAFPPDTPNEECNRILEEKQKADESRVYYVKVMKYRREASPEILVAETFLTQYKGRDKIWHKDGDKTNNWYKNLLMVTAQDYKDLKDGKVTWQELDLEQEYIEYENKASYMSYVIYYGIKSRCGDTKDNDKIRACYDNVTMWQGWLDNPRAFAKWYLEHYYEVDDEEMDVDKDLLGDGSGMYHPDFCCILPIGLNALLANSKKHYYEGQNEENTLPLGVSYNSRINKYYGTITFTGSERAIMLSCWDTPEEAFAEYKAMKQADILRVAAEYKDKIPEYVYKALLKVEVKPY